jgi:hypothetical protein
VAPPSAAALAWRALAREHDLPVQPPADAAAVAGLVAEAEAALGAAPPPEYLDLLRDQDGGEVNGFRFFPTRSAPLLGGHGAVLPGLVEVNRDMREGGGLDGYVVLGEGCVCLRAFHPASGAFQELDRVALDVVVVHGSFLDMMRAAIEAHR